MRALIPFMRVSPLGSNYLPRSSPPIGFWHMNFGRDTNTQSIGQSPQPHFQPNYCLWVLLERSSESAVTHNNSKHQNNGVLRAPLSTCSCPGGMNEGNSESEKYGFNMSLPLIDFVTPGTFFFPPCCFCFLFSKMGRWYCPPRVDVTVLCNQEKLLLAPASHQGSSVSSLLLKRHRRGADSECPSLSNIHTVHNLDVHNCMSTFLNLQHLSQVWIFLLFLPTTLIYWVLTGDGRCSNQSA